MKTLNEVIKALEICHHVGNVDCSPCPYYPGKGWCEEKDADALHYLEEYRKLDSIDAVAFPEDDNSPLDWSELKQMEGKPVWMEYEEDKYMYKEWTIITDIFDTDNCKAIKVVRIDSDRYPVPIYLWRRRTAWQAYRKERS